jgi:thiamine-phosphate pyrophosphorylase
MPGRVIVITSPGSIGDETETCVNLLKAGLHRLHIRKPFHSKNETRSFIEKIPHEWREKLVIHRHPDLMQEMKLGGCHFSYRDDITVMNNCQGRVSCSVHSWTEAQAVIHRCSYVFISPVFNSISKQGYAANSSLLNIPRHLQARNIYALGGVNETNARTALNMGYRGVALMGYLWQEPSLAVKLFERVIHQTGNMYETG